MEGTFKGWLTGKSYGFIVPADGSEDVFLHQNVVKDFQQLRPGTRIAFDHETTDKRRNAVCIEVLGAPSTPAPTSPEHRCGRVKIWKDNGYGFIEPEDGSADVFVHSTALPPEVFGYLCESDRVEFQVAEGHKGLEACAIAVTGWTAPKDHLAAFADMGGAGWLEKLANLAEDEPWQYKHTTAPDPLPILRSYVRHTFHRLEEMGDGIAFSTDAQSAAFNTGLVTPNQEEIYALFRKNPKIGRQPWRLAGFRKASDWEFIDPFGKSPPPLAHYFADPSVLLYDRRCELYVNIDHVMEQIARFPAHLQANSYVARQLLISAEATTKKRVYRNYKTAIPQYYRDKGGAGGVQLLLPICLENPARADLALVVAKSEMSDAYRGSTVLTLDMAYNNARLLARPDTEWLQP